MADRNAPGEAPARIFSVSPREGGSASATRLRTRCLSRVSRGCGASGRGGDAPSAPRWHRRRAGTHRTRRAAPCPRRAAAHRRDGAEDDRQHETLLERERLAGAGQREQSHRQRVGEEHRGIEMAEQPAEVEHERADGDADEDEIGVRGEVHPVGLQQHVADDAATVPGDQAQHHRADDVELAVAREQSARQHANDDGEIIDAPRHREHLRIGERLLQKCGVHTPLSESALMKPHLQVLR